MLARVSSLLALLALTTAACSRPDPPTLTPESAEVTSLTTTGIGLGLLILAKNPNKVDLSARTVTASITLDGKYDLGTVTAPTPVLLPAGKETEMVVPLAVKWTDVAALFTMAQANRGVPYRVEGKVNLGGDLLNVDVPFHLEGVVSHEQLVQATIRSLPRLPGLPGLPD